jgi:3-methylfumaryl-CoA hydratase
MDYAEWVGNTDSQRDNMAPEQLQKFEAMMNRQADSVTDGSELSLCSHWAYFSPVVQTSDLTVQGYPRDESFMPPIELASRLWLGGRLEFKEPLVTGTPADRFSTIIKAEEKESERGKQFYLSVQHQISAKGSVSVREIQHFLYRERSEKGAHPTRSQPMDIDPDWQKTTKPDSILLFRFSALTSNAHRIHYDQEFAREVEGYPNVVVHGPLLLLLALEAFKNKHDGKVIEWVDYQITGPVYLGEQITIAGKIVDNHTCDLRICGPDKKLSLKASVKWKYSW